MAEQFGESALTADLPLQATSAYLLAAPPCLTGFSRGYPS
jgi:hypothetical protein